MQQANYVNYFLHIICLLHDFKEPLNMQINWDIHFHRFVLQQVLDMATTPAVCSLVSLLPTLFLLQVQQQV